MVEAGRAAEQIVAAAVAVQDVDAFVAADHRIRRRDAVVAAEVVVVGTTPQNVIAAVLERSQGKQAAVEYLSDKVKHQPSLIGIQKLVLYKEKELDADEVFNDLSTAISVMQKDKVAYRCQKCGFSTNTHYWLCPSCNHWGRVKPSIIENGN